jgi:three-Cys-motif partner protein
LEVTSLYPVASDGLVARDSGEWASDKLFYVGRYMAIFAGGMKNKWPRRAYLDLMSGPGRCLVLDTGREFDGSPLLALKTKEPFTDVILVEAEPILAAALRQRTHAAGLRPSPVIVSADCNELAVIDDLRGRVNRGTVTLTFVDLLGMNVTMATLRRLTMNLPMDLIITFPEMDVVRNWQAAVSDDPEHAVRFDEFFGATGWRSAIAQTKPGEREADAMIRFYGQQLQDLGYHVSVLPLTMKNSRGGTLYRPIFASRHATGTKFWTEISAKKDPSGQGRLL